MISLRLTQALIIFLMAALAPIQVLVMPLAAADMAQSAPEFAHLRWPLLVLAEFMMLVADALLVALLKLVALTARRAVLSRLAVRWVDLLIAALWVETAAVAPWLAVVGWVTHGPPGASLVCLLALVAGTAAALIVTAMKDLLIQATTQADELAAVI
ncbi:MAG: DUF2975 domain-containing protein [Bifidobacteriaceae bacterium]|jgi:hypothetical protein|nr:DUF2975 domain-containing protein [Bifidobacteriaceae bacterium]